jgi:hypothetical protein
MAFKKAERTQLHLRCALFGPSGSGKTMSALRIAKAIAEKTGGNFAVIDTESQSASKYADRFSFDVNDLGRKTVDDYITAMQEAAQAGYKVLVIDTHAWRELTDEVDRITLSSPTKNSFLSWSKVNPKQKRFVDAILSYPGHVIVTMRSKTEWVVGEGRNGKSMPQKLGLAPEQGKGIEYEFDILIELDQSHTGTVSKDRTGKFQDETIEKPGEEFGVALYNWLNQGTAPASPPASVPTPASEPDPQILEKRKRLLEYIKAVLNSEHDGEPIFSQEELDQYHNQALSFGNKNHLEAIEKMYTEVVNIKDERIMLIEEANHGF